MGNPDEGERTFLQKWRDQLADQPEDVHRVAVDLLAFYYLFPSNVTLQHKVAVLGEVIGWRLGERPPDFELLQRAYTAKVGHAGMQYGLAIPWQLTLFLETFRRVHAESVASTDHKGYQRIADEIKEKVGRSGSGRNILLHLFFPERYERISSEDHKRKIVTAFGYRTGGAQDEDEKLLNIRRSFEEESDRDNFDFYDEDVEPLWKPKGKQEKALGTRV